MNNIEDIIFQQKPIRISRGSDGGIYAICLNDICEILKRTAFLKNGMAARRCPSATPLDESRPKELFAGFDEAVGFIKWMVDGSKMLEIIGRDLLELLQQSRFIKGVWVELPDESLPESGTASEELIVLEYAGNTFSMKMADGRYMVNATEMARPFEKRPKVWLNLVETLKLRQALVDDGIFRDIESQVITSRGPHGATWLEIHLWVQFAQWLSPAFAAWCSKKIVPLMRNDNENAANASSGRKTKQSGQFEDLDISDDSFLPVPHNYEDAIAVIETQKDTIRKQRTFLRENKHKFEHYEETIETREWFSATIIANELGISAIQLNQFLMDEGVQDKIRDEWVIAPEYRHLRDIHFYEWYNHKTKYTNKYKIDSWTPEGREFIIELWKKNNG